MSSSSSVLPSKVESLARYGYLAKGLVYCVLGVLIALGAFGIAGGRVTGTDGVIDVVSGAVAGRILLIILFLGLAAHVFWRVYQAFADPSDKGRSPKALVQRLGYLVSALAYLSLTSAALGHLTTLWPGSSGSGSDTSSKSMAAELISTPGGSIALGAIGLIVIGVGFYQAWRAWSQPFKDKWSAKHVSSRILNLLSGLASAGIASRAILFVMIGWKLARAGWFSDSGEVIDTASALWQISSEAMGNWLLAGMGVGLFLYGIYSLTNAALRRIE